MKKDKNEQARQASMQNISSSALELFIEVGYINTTIEQIAKKANISKGLMYNYFSSKEELLMYIIDQIMAELVEVSKIILNTKESISKIELIIKTTFQLLREKSDFWQTIIPVITQKAISEKMESKLRVLIKSMTENLTQTFTACGVKNAEMEAYQLGAILDGIALHYFYVFKEEYPLEKIETALIYKYSKLIENEQ